MSKWDELAGEKGQKVETGRFGRAFKLGKLAAGVTGSVIKATFQSRKGSESEKLEAVTDAAMRNARQIVAVMGEMKGAAMKVGQILSSDPDLVAPEFADALSSLQRSAPPMEYTTVKQVVEQAFDRPIETLFATFDPEPIGAASIGQVHRATLTDGRAVAVKIQYPGIAESLESDLRNLGTLLKVGRVIMTKERVDGFVAEARAALLSEADYEKEAENLVFFRALLADVPGVRAPEPYLEFCRKTVLVMEFIAGDKLDDALMAIEDPERRAALATRFVSLFVHMMHDKQHLHGDPHPGNFMLDADDNIILLDFGCVRQFEPRLSDGILHMLRAYWDRDWARLEQLYRDFGFGKVGMTMPSHEVMAEYHDLILAPLKTNEPFNYHDWSVHTQARKFMREHLELIKLVPPPDLLLYFRVLVGIKGIMSRVDAAIAVRPIAEAACERRGI